MGYVHFKEVLYETIRFAYREDVFRKGNPEGNKQMKQRDKEIRFRLHHRRLVNISTKSEHYGPSSSCCKRTYS